MVGESVKIGNHEVGVVEVVGLRSTRIRTADDTLLIVPNSNLTTMEITNYGRRRYRRYQTRIGVAYATSLEQLIAFRDGIKDVIRKQRRGRARTISRWPINELAASAIEILVNVYFEVAVTPGRNSAARDALIAGDPSTGRGHEHRVGLPDANDSLDCSASRSTFVQRTGGQPEASESPAH